MVASIAQVGQKVAEDLAPISIRRRFLEDKRSRTATRSTVPPALEALLVLAPNCPSLSSALERM